MNKKIAFERPLCGIFYLVPDPKTKNYTLYVEHEEEGKDTLHLYLWPRMAGLLSSRFKVDKKLILDAYTGIPRGRVTTTTNNQWVVAHGGDFPLETYKFDIISQFSLADAEAIGKVRWEIAPHEKMGDADKKIVEVALGIVIAPNGWRKV
jgi:hypothetical protein